MSKAYLTIDDGPNKNTKKIIDFLNSKDITPIMFFYGEQINKAKEEGIYAIQNGAIIGNHSFTHPHFSNLKFDECISEIEHQEEQIELLYKAAEVDRKYKLFRFPYGDKGGNNQKALQEYFANNGFCRINDTSIDYDWYHKFNFDKDYDVFWTFDFGEYQLEYNSNFTYGDIVKRIHDDNPITGGPLLALNASNIILIHDHEKTEEVRPGYFSELINHVLDKGVEFVKPMFINP